MVVNRFRKNDVIYASSPFNVPSFHKWVVLDNGNLSLMNLLDVDIENLSASKNDIHIKPGDICSIGIEGIEGVEFGKLYFLIYGAIKEYKGQNLNSYIVKEVAIDDDGNVTENVNASGRKKFSIPPSMCKMLNIKYSPGFELWPITDAFKKVNLKRRKEIIYNDMSTYPTSDVDGTIRKIFLELHGFSPFNQSHIITPTGAMLSTGNFLSSLTVFARKNISTDKGCAGFMANENFKFKVVTRASNINCSICDDSHNIYLEVDTTKKSYNVNTADGLIGISHTSLDGNDIDDVIGVKWDEATDDNSLNEIQKRMDLLNSRINNINVNTEEIFRSLVRHFRDKPYDWDYYTSWKRE